MKRDDIVEGMQAIYSPGFNRELKMRVTVVRRTETASVVIMFADGGTRNALPSDLHPAPKRPSARRKPVGLESIMSEYRAAGGRVTDRDLEKLRAELSNVRKVGGR